MKKLLLPLILATVMLTGCTSPSTKMTDDQLFQKKQECASYKELAEKNMKNYISKDSIGQNIDEDIVNGKIRLYLRDVFYSKALNTCLYAFNEAQDKVIDIESIIQIRYYIADSLTNSLIYETSQECLDNYSCNIDEEFNIKLKNLKGE